LCSLLFVERATAYRTKDAFVVHAESRTTDGVWIATEPYIRLRMGCSLDELGEAVLAALAASRSEVAHPTDWKGVLKPLVKVAGLKSWSSLARVARCVGVEASSEGIAFVPSENLGPREGFAPRTDLALLVSRAAGAAALGRALSEAIEQSK
jgi:hypothetical protein